MFYILKNTKMLILGMFCFIFLKIIGYKWFLRPQPFSQTGQLEYIALRKVEIVGDKCN